MFDIEIALANEPGQLALLGETLGKAGISVEGGGMFLAGDIGLAHFLVHDGSTAQSTLRAAGISVGECRRVVTTRLRQDEPGQLGAVCRALADAGVNIEVLYSDHIGRLILLLDDPEVGQAVCDRFRDETPDPTTSP